MKLISISKDVLFEKHLQNYGYKVIRADHCVCYVTIADFPLMNSKDLITLDYLIKILGDKQRTDKAGIYFGVCICELFHRLLSCTSWLI